MVFAAVFQPRADRMARTSAHGAVTVIGETRVLDRPWSYTIRLANGRTVPVAPHLLREDDLSIPPPPTGARSVP